MIQGLNEIPLWQRFMLFSLGVVLFVWAMHIWVWSPLDSSIATLTQEIEELTHKNHESIQNMALLPEVEQEVITLRAKLLLRHQQLPVKVEPQSFRRAVVSIGKQTGVAIRLWNPQKSVGNVQDSDASLDVAVKVEGSFYDTVQFMNDVLQLSWVETVNPLIFVRKHDDSKASIVTTEFTIKGLVSIEFSETGRLLKT